MYIVYILKSIKQPRRYYIGLTEDLDARLARHNSDENDSYSKRYAPWEIETYIVFKNKLLAEDFEKYLKVGSGNAFLKRRLITSTKLVP